MTNAQGKLGSELLERALDEKLMLPMLARALGLPEDRTAALCCRAEVLNQKAGQRWIIRYRLESVDAVAGSPAAVTLLGKLYRKRHRASRMYERMLALSGVFDSRQPCSTPAPLLLMPQLGLVLQEYVEGVDLRHVLCDAEAPLVFTAQWLARLHASPPLAGLRALSLQHELSKMDGWCREVLAHLPDAKARRLHNARDSFSGLANEMPASARAMIHRDFYYANVLWDGRQVWILDFDQLCVGDPALDVGHFLAHLEYLAYRTTGRHDSFSRQADLFLRSYEEASPESPRDRLPMYRAYTFLKLAATAVGRRREGWQERTGLLTDLACREVESSV